MADEDIAALQEEESEVLKSIYEGDAAFSALSASKYQYKVGNADADSGGKDAFLVEFEWPGTYPNVLPVIKMDAFFNRHILAEVKAKIISTAEEEGQQYLGMSMTYTLIEYIKENFDSLMENQPETSSEVIVAEAVEKVSLEDPGGNAKKEKKEQLTKAQKRRMWKQGGLDESDRERGWNWVDVIRHLSQTGPKDEDSWQKYIQSCYMYVYYVYYMPVFFTYCTILWNGDKLGSSLHILREFVGSVCPSEVWTLVRSFWAGSSAPQTAKCRHSTLPWMPLPVHSFRLKRGAQYATRSSQQSSGQRSHSSLFRRQSWKSNR